MRTSASQHYGHGVYTGNGIGLYGAGWQSTPDTLTYVRLYVVEWVGEGCRAVLWVTYDSVRAHSNCRVSSAASELS